MRVNPSDDVRQGFQGIADQAPSREAVATKMDVLVRRRRARNLTGITASVIALLCAGPLLIGTMTSGSDTPAARPAAAAPPVNDGAEDLPRSGMCFSKAAVNSRSESFVIATKVGVPESRQLLKVQDFFDVCAEHWDGSTFVDQSAPDPSRSPKEAREGLAACWLTDNVIGVFPRSPRVAVDDPCATLGMRAVTNG